MFKQINKKFLEIDGVVDGDERLIEKISKEFLEEGIFFPFIQKIKNRTIKKESKQVLKRIIEENSDLEKVFENDN